jgi:indolepyruvate decarboxylase
VVFVLANGIYGIEQKLVNPNPFRTPSKGYQDQLLNQVYSYNRLHDWQYEKLMDVFGGEGRVVATVARLSSVLAEIDARPSDNFLVHVKLPTTDTPKALKPGLSGPGEDETANSDWPPELLF